MEKIEAVQPKADVVFELSWEVCNKVGGIYTVVKSKAAQMVEKYGENYFLVGPYFPGKEVSEFSEEMPHDFCKNVIEDLKNEGIICHFGKWLTDGSPNVILIDFEETKKKINEIKGDLWQQYQIDSMRAAHDYDEPLAWSHACGRVIEALSSCLSGKKIVAHCHEWLAGGAILYLKGKGISVGTAFTTHATTLGRTLCAAQQDLYSIWDKIDPLMEAKKYSVEAKHMLEKQAALNADTFTTVSEITSMEAEHLLGRKADVLVLNGLDIGLFPTFEEIAIKHKLQKNRMKQFLISYFFPYYDFDLSNTLLYFLAGRFEFKNKGIDVFIDALGKLNKKLQKAKDPKTVVAFIFVPGNIRNIKPDLLENKTYYQDIRESVDDAKEELEQNLINSIISGRKISKETLFDKSLIMEMKSKVKRFKKKGSPPTCTHDLNDDHNDVVEAFKRAGLENKEKDPVKVIYYPIYLSGADHLLNLNYYEVIEASHLGVFPSYYEPWGYTPLESGALGVASVTTDLAGFGRFFCNNCKQGKMPGIFMLNRMNKEYNDVVDHMTDILYHFQSFNKQERTQNKMQARKIAATCDWRLFVNNYIAAHNKAIENIG